MRKGESIQIVAINWMKVIITEIREEGAEQSVTFVDGDYLDCTGKVCFFFFLFCNINSYTNPECSFLKTD